MRTLVLTIHVTFLLAIAHASEPNHSEKSLKAEFATSIVAYYESASSCREVGGISVEEYIGARHNVLERLTQLIGRHSALLTVEEWEAPESYGSDGDPEFEAFKKQAEEAFDELRDQMNTEVGPWIRQRCVARLMDGDYKSALLAEKLRSITPPP